MMSTKVSLITIRGGHETSDYQKNRILGSSMVAINVLERT